MRENGFEHRNRSDHPDLPRLGFTNEMGEAKGRGYKVNLPLPPLTNGECYLHAFDEVVPPLLKAFKPQVIVNQFGVDTHFDDPLAHLSLTMKAYGELASRLHTIAHEVCRGRYIVLGGGGYKPESVARAWTIMFSKISEITIPDRMPEKVDQFLQGSSQKRAARHILR